MDSITRLAPEREKTRRSRLSVYGAPDLNPWDLYLAGDPEEDALTFIMARVADLERRYTLTPTRAEAFEIMRQAGWATPEYGRIGAQWPLEGQWVVYTNEYGGHVGQDKVLCGAEVARCEWRGHLACAFIPEASGHSTRHLQVGDYRVAMRMRTQRSGEWRSNVGGTEIEIDGIEYLPMGEEALLLGPLWAIDTVGEGLAVDFNVVPGLDSVSHLLPDPLESLMRSWLDNKKISKR